MDQSGNAKKYRSPLSEISLAKLFVSKNKQLTKEAGLLNEIKDEIVRILSTRSIITLNSGFLSRPLSYRMLTQKDHLLGEEYFHGIFQMED